MAAAYWWTFGSRISFRYFYQLEFLHGTHGDQCDHRMRSLPKPWFHHLCICVFQHCWIDGIWWVFPTRSAYILNRSTMNQDSSLKNTEIHCRLVQEAHFLAQHKRALLWRPFSENTHSLSHWIKTWILNSPSHRSSRVPPPPWCYKTVCNKLRHSSEHSPSSQNNLKTVLCRYSNSWSAMNISSF